MLRTLLMLAVEWSVGLLLVLVWEVLLVPLLVLVSGSLCPMDNWCYCEIGSLESSGTKLCFGTYNSSDTLYWKTYWNEYKNQNSNWVMSAGQPQDGSFQLCIWVAGDNRDQTSRCCLLSRSHSCREEKRNLLRSSLQRSISS